MLKKSIFTIVATSTIAACDGGSGDSSSPSTQTVVDSPSSISTSPIDTVLVATSGQVVSQFVDAVAEGVPYKSTSGAGSTYEGKTNAIGQFISYPGGNTEFKISNVNLGTWYEPNTGQGAGGGSIVQLPQLSYGQTACSSLDTTTTARLLLGLSSYQNFYHIKIADTTTLTGCPQDTNFFSKNSINITPTQASAHVTSTATRLDIQKQIAALLFNIPATDVERVIDL